MSDSNDLNLINRISKRDKKALSELYDIHSGFLYSLILNIINEKGESENILKEVFISVWNKADTYDETLGCPLSWITSIARNKSVCRLRNNGNNEFPVPTKLDKFIDLTDYSIPEDSDLTEFMQKEKNEVLHAIRILNKDQKELIELTFFKGMSVSEIAGYFKIPEGTVKMRLRAAMISLQDGIRDQLN